MEIDGACALITGSSGGLGTVLATTLAAEGANVAICYRTGAERAEDVKALVEEQGRTALPVYLDQTNPNSVDDAIEKVVGFFGGVDLLINNAGMASGGHSLPIGDLEALTPEIWDEMMAVNIRGPYLMARAAAPYLRQSKWGKIVNLGSTIGHGIWGAGAAYAPSKGAVAPLTRFLAAALAPDVAVNCVAPGLMEGTEMSGAAPEAYIDGWRNQAILGQTTSLQDVASHIVGFCKSEAVTGQVLIVDGGIHFN
ncbi:MAG: SDR family oxidoreductase [Proteobacteria bacterium]|nr:SDR family oxidoreductase [Pseudomonadota bacterium]